MVRVTRGWRDQSENLVEVWWGNSYKSEFQGLDVNFIHSVTFSGFNNELIPYSPFSSLSFETSIVTLCLSSYFLLCCCSPDTRRHTTRAVVQLHRNFTFPLIHTTMPYQPPSTRHSLPPRPPSTSEIPNPLQRLPDTSPPSSKQPRMDDHASNEPQRIRSDGAGPYITPNPQNSQPQRVRFNIRPVARFQGQSATIKRPREIAHFSYDDEHEYKEDDSGINYYCPPALGSDFREGFDTFKHYEEKEDPHLDSLLKTIISKEKKEGTKVETDFVTWRGMMTKV